MGKDLRLRLSLLGEYYDDLLKLDAYISGRSKASQASNLLKSKLQEREPLINNRLKVLASKRGVTEADLRSSILDGSFTDAL
jgi:hypothetical protein